MKYEATFVDVAGIEDHAVEFEFDPEAHESFPHIRPEFAIALAIDSPALSLAEFQTWVEGHLETTVAGGWLIVVNEESVLLNMPRNPHPDIAERALLLGSPLCGPLVFIRERVTTAGGASSSPSTDSAPAAT